MLIHQILDGTIVVAVLVAVFLIARRQPVGEDRRRPALTRPGLRAALIIIVLGVALTLIVALG